VLAEVILLMAKVWVRRQRPQLRKQHKAAHDNIRALYDVESRRYLHTHARTTCRDDDAWRLWLGQTLVGKIRDVNAQQHRPARHLDLFGGSGLSYLSQAKVFHLHDVAVNSVLLDASSGMLDVATTCTIPDIEQLGLARHVAASLSDADKLSMRQECCRTVEVLQADPDGDGAAPMPGGPGRPSPIAADSLDVASIMFGLGAIPLGKAASLAKSLLRILAEGGRFATTDMHRPVAELAARWSWPVPLEMRSAWIEREGYRRITIPYVLWRLWGWYDPTFYPHVMKLATIKTGDAWYGWDEVLFVLQSRRWDFGVPTMPTYQQVLVKVRISEQEAAEREQASQALLACAELARN
jgi:SAM-dependent methyltransferase